MGEVGDEVQLLNLERVQGWPASNLIYEALFLCAYGASIRRLLLQ